MGGRIMGVGANYRGSELWGGGGGHCVCGGGGGIIGGMGG